MRKLNIKQVEKYVNKNIVQFHNNKIKALKQLNLKQVLGKKNPYLFKAKNIILAADLIDNVLGAFLSSSEEKIFGDFLEDLAIFVASKTCNGRKSTTKGIDLEFDYILKVHSKKSIHSGRDKKRANEWQKSGQEWRDQLTSPIMGDGEIIDNVLSLFGSSKEIGIIGSNLNRSNLAQNIVPATNLISCIGYTILNRCVYS